MSSEVAFLVYYPLKVRGNRKDISFDGHSNIGAQVIKQILERAGIPVGFCSPETAHEFKVVLVSFTSSFDLLAFYKAVALLSSWKPGRRKFKVIAGGAGMQNPVSVRQYVDYAAFGRAESFVVPLVQAALQGDEAGHPSVMNLPAITEVQFCQATELYPEAIGSWKESQIGCPRKCSFCNYSWARKHVGAGEFRGTNIAGADHSPEVTWDGIATEVQTHKRLTTSIDGSSARLRSAVNKPLSSEDLVAGIEAAGSVEGATVFLSVFNIVNYPTETQADRDELDATLRRAHPKRKVVVSLRPTPFRPSLATPMQWEPVTLFPSARDNGQQMVVNYPTLRAVYTGCIEAPWSHLLVSILDRAVPTDEFERMLHLIVFASKLNSGTWADKLNRLKAVFDLSPYLREYDFDEEHPAWFLRSFTSPEDLKRAGRMVRARLHEEVV